jgi:DNA-binding NarL/FixJ family response regulator
MRVYILEDCEIFRLSLMLVLGRESDIEIAGATGSNSGDICKQILASQCDVLLIGLRLRNQTGLDIARELKTANPTIPILGLGFATDAAFKSELQMSGINVFIPMTASNDFIISKLRNARESLGRCDFPCVDSSARISIIPASK